MKVLLILATLFISLSAQASVYPQLTVWPSGADVRISNYTDKDVRCSGMIYIYTQSGKFKTEFYNSTVYRGMTDYRHFTNFYMNDPYRNGHHSIYCYAY